MGEKFTETDIAEDDLDPIFDRIKSSIDLKGIKAVSPEKFREELKQKMKDSRDYEPYDPDQPQRSLKFLINKQYPERAVENKQLFKRLLKESIKIKEIHVKGKKATYSRFQIIKGTETSRTKSGRKIKAGMFIKGKSRNEAYDNLYQLFDGGKTK